MLAHPDDSGARARSPCVSRLIRLVQLSGTAFVLIAGSMVVSSGQTVSEPVAKAAFLLNFARFTEWPAPASAGDPLRICTSDRDVADALDATVAGRAAGNRPVISERVDLNDHYDGCAVLYVTDVGRRRATRLLASLSAAPVLTVSDESGFAAWGGSIELFLENGRMGFLINRTAAERVGLRFSSRLLGLARLLKD